MKNRSSNKPDEGSYVKFNTPCGKEEFGKVIDCLAIQFTVESVSGFHYVFYTDTWRPLPL